MDDDSKEKIVSFVLGGMLFEYDPRKNEENARKHGISFRSAARVFFDYDRIEFYDEDNSSQDEDRFDTIGDLSAGMIGADGSISETTIGNVGAFYGGNDDVVFVVYTERMYENKKGETREVTRLISARMATSFERGLYYGKFE